MQSNTVSKKQKILAYLIILITISSFFLMRAHKNKIQIERAIKTTNLAETSLSESLFYLYNNDLSNSICPYIYSDSKDYLIEKFEKTNSIMSESSLKLSYVKLKKDRIYKTKLNGSSYTVYKGTVDLQWSFTDKDTVSDKATKKITAYLKEDSDKYYIHDIKLSEKK